MNFKFSLPSLATLAWPALLAAGRGTNDNLLAAADETSPTANTGPLPARQCAPAPIHAALSARRECGSDPPSHLPNMPPVFTLLACLLGTSLLVATPIQLHAAPAGPSTDLAAPTPAVRALANPAGPGAMGSALTTTPDGTVLLSWLEPIGAEVWALKFSRFEAATKNWGVARAIATGRDWFINWADFPSVTPLSDTDLMAVWFENNPDGAHHDGHHGSGYHARYSLSHDSGATWSTPHRLTGESAVTEFAAVLALGEQSRALVAWLDGRARAGHRPVQALYAQTMAAGGADMLVDSSVCDCCQLALVRVGDDALLAYRGRTDNEVRDIWLARWRHGAWEAPRALHDDAWEISACPVNGPRLVARGEHVAAIWFTAAQGKPRVQAKVSRDGGETFGDVLAIDLGRPQGRVDAVMLDNGTTLFTWLELTGNEAGKAGGIFLRRLSAAGEMSDAELLAPSTTARAGGFPRIAQLSPTQLLLSYTAQNGVSRVATLLIDFN